MFENLGPKFANALADENLVSANVLSQAKKLSAETNSRLDEVLVKLGHLTPSAINDVIHTQLAVQQICKTDMELGRAPDIEISVQYFRENKLIPLDVEGGLLLAMQDPLDDVAAKLIFLKTGRTFTRVSISKKNFETLWNKIFVDFHQSSSVGGIIAKTKKEEVELSSDDLNTLRDSKSDAPTIRYMTDLINFATLDGCSDIHIRPDAYGADIFVRKDGVLSFHDKIETGQLKNLISRIKIVAKLDVSETRLPQDGKFMQAVSGSRTDIRVATMPQIHGEGAVLRILGRQIDTKNFKALGFDDPMSNQIEKLFALQEGLALVVGPTGSGKSTTLYTALNRLAQTEQNIITIEDPVEIQKEGTNQVQVDESTGLTFPRALRAALRQDPDIILIGEIRDGETASIAVQAALTGHIVLASLHTSSALSAIPRLIDMGVEPYLLGAVLKGVLAQRLVPKRCPTCRVNDKNDGTVCETCGGTGVQGRQILGEIALLNERLVAKISKLGTANIDPAGNEGLLNSESILTQAHRLYEAGQIAKEQLQWMRPSD